jgi:hypothetical protein
MWDVHVCHCRVPHLRAAVFGAKVGSSALHFSNGVVLGLAFAFAIALTFAIALAFAFVFALTFAFVFALTVSP